MALDCPPKRHLPPEYGPWSAMRRRCGNPACSKFCLYGGRGIRVCDRWRSFPAFLADMGARPSPKHTLDRIDKDGHYEPGNVRWADPKTQQRNRRTNRVLVVHGERMTAVEASERYGVPYARLMGRLRMGWPDERAATQPFARRGPRADLTRAAAAAGLPAHVVRYRLANGETLAEAVSRPKGPRGRKPKRQARISGPIPATADPEPGPTPFARQAAP